MQTVAKLLLYLHIVAGFTALVTGAIALGANKGGKVHRKAGSVYFYAMLTVTFTALLISLLKSLVFLLMIAIFSGYMTWTGYRALQFRRSRKKGAVLLDWIVLTLAGLFVLWMGAEAIRLSFPVGFIFNSFALVLIVFGAIFGIFIGQDFRVFRQIETFSSSDWLRLHIGRMCGAYIATCTAFLVVNVHVQPAFIPWLLPVAIGTPLISYFIRKYTVKKPAAYLAETT